MPPPLGRALSDDAVWRLSLSVWRLSVCLSRTSGLSREQRGPRRPKLAHTPLSRSKGQRSRSTVRFAHRHVGASGGCSCGRGNVLAGGNCVYVAVCSAAHDASAPTGEERGGAYCGGRPPTACCDCALYKFVVDIEYSRPLVYTCLHSSDWMSKSS